MASGLAAAQSRRDLSKVGVLWTVDPSTAAPYLASFKEGLRALGWIEGRTIQIIERYDAGDSAGRPELAAELVALGVDVLYVSDSALPAARSATKTIPIVCADFYDPILEGITTSMARPDGNVTGVSWQSVESAGKRVQLTQELKPRTRRVGLMFDANDPGALMELRGILTAARQARIAVEKLDLRAPNDIEPALAKLRGARLDALIVSANTLTWPVIDRIVEVASARDIPVISEPEDFAKAGAIITYGPDMFALYRRSASFVDRILKGAAPKDLPIEKPTRFELVVNLKTAKTLRLAIPKSIMERATKVIR
jgi:putative ABC transport system substrate-binding protein